MMSDVQEVIVSPYLLCVVSLLQVDLCLCLWFVGMPASSEGGRDGGGGVLARRWRVGGGAVM